MYFSRGLSPFLLQINPPIGYLQTVLNFSFAWLKKRGKVVAEAIGETL